VEPGRAVQVERWIEAVAVEVADVLMGAPGDAWRCRLQRFPVALVERQAVIPTF
jgi:hypothetical protein